MSVTGSKENVGEFIKIMKADYSGKPDDPLHLWRIFEADETDTEELGDGIIRTYIDGDCAWSVNSCMFENGYSYQSQHKKDPDNRGTTVPAESERLNLVIEIYSSEPGCAFQKHYLVAFGEILDDDCIDWEEHYIGDTTIETYNKEWDTNFTEEDMDADGYIIKGGFGEWNYEDSLFRFKGKIDTLVEEKESTVVILETDWLSIINM
jgi:hypothetical protein